MKRFLFTLCALCTASLASADEWYDESTGYTWTYTLSGTNATIANVSPDTGTDLTIPNKVGNNGEYTVTGIEGKPPTYYVPSSSPYVSFTGCIIIPEGVVSIGDYAFKGCHRLTSVFLPDSITEFGHNVFQNCSFFTDEDGAVYESERKKVLISAPNTLQGEYEISNTVKFIHTYAFENCQNLTSIKIPGSVDTISVGAFKYCSPSVKFIIEEGVKRIKGRWISPDGAYVYEGTFPSDMESITLPSSIIEIENYAFGDLYSSPDPKTVQLVFNGALKQDYWPIGVNKTSKIKFEIPSSVTTIGNEAFSGCSGLTSVTIPESVTTIGVNAFYNCSSLTSVTILEGVTEIGLGAFYGCSSLTSVTIPEGVTEIGWGAFYGCSGLTSVTIPEGVTEIVNQVFYGCSSLTSMTIPEGVTSIGSSAFRGCSSLTSVTIPEGVTEIGWDAFSGCSSLTSVTIPSSVTTIGGYAFRGCSGLTSITIPSSVTTIGGYAFRGCSGLTSITIPSSVTSVGPNAFYGVPNLTFEGAPPTGVMTSVSPWRADISYPDAYADAWENIIAISKCQVSIIASANVSVSAEMTTPKTMKVTYTVESTLPTAKVRAVAFANGERSFARIVPVKNGTNVPNGRAVQTHKKHTFTWNVSEDWKTDLSKVAIEILVQEGELLPRRRVGVPALNGWEKMTITTNTITSAQAFNALLWCVAEGDTALTISNGVVRASGTQIASGISVSQNANLLNYLYGKMGYQVLSGDRLTHVKSVTRLNLPSSGLNQVAYKIEEESTEE